MLSIGETTIYEMQQNHRIENCTHTYRYGEVFEHCEQPEQVDSVGFWQGLNNLIQDAGNSINVWWHGGNDNNEGTRFSQFWCGFAGANYEGWNYNFVSGACNLYGEHHSIERF